MIHPSYVELMKVVNEETALVGEEPVVNSRYSIVCATAKRARQIIDGDYPYIDGSAGMKPLSIAVEELYEGKLKILTEEEVAEKDAELKDYLDKKSKQDAIYEARIREEDKHRREEEAKAAAEAEKKAAAAALAKAVASEDYDDEDFDDAAEEAFDEDDADEDIDELEEDDEPLDEEA